MKSKNRSTNIKRTFKRGLTLCGILSILLMLPAVFSTSSKAAGKYKTFDILSGSQKHTVNGSVIFANHVNTAEMDLGGMPIQCEYYKLRVIRNKISTVITSRAYGPYITNGQIIYYSQLSKRSTTCTIYRYNIKKNSREKMAAGELARCYDFSGKYLIYGFHIDASPNGLLLNDTRSINISTKKSHKLSPILDRYIFKKYIVGQYYVPVGADDAIYSYRINGTGKKKIGTGYMICQQNGRVYYRQKKGSGKITIYSCKPDGSDTRTENRSSIPDKYSDYINW